MKKINRSIACFILFGLVLFGLGIFEVLDRRGDNAETNILINSKFVLANWRKTSKNLETSSNKMNGLLDKN